MDSELVDYRKWQKVNDNDFSLYDYLHGNLVSEVFVSDVIFSFSKLLFPDFLEEDGMIFLKEQYVEKKIQGFRAEKKRKEIEYWINILSLTSILEGFSESFIDSLSFKIKKCWEDQLFEKYPLLCFDVSLLKDEGDILITFCQIDNTQP